MKGSVDFLLRPFRSKQVLTQPFSALFCRLVMKVQTITVGPFQVNCYLVWDEESGDGVIIDPGAEAGTIIAKVKESGCTPKAILLTHGHGDHIAAVAEIKDEYHLPLYIGKGEEELLENPSANVSAMFSQPIVAPPADKLLGDEEIVSAGTMQLKTFSTPGHSPGGVCYLHERRAILFCGDTLFQGSIGRTDFPGCSHSKLINSIETKILTLPDEVVCFPGHGPATTVGAERTGNPFLTGRYFA